MRLWKCHIDNFGKFTDFTVDFTDNPCVFKEPNGWGKSTLAAFVKVMFYGFANEKKRGDTLERERLRYKPWQGGSYGGELEFEAGGKRYLLNRTFGNKESEDTFALYDADTKLSSDAFTANIGEELFQIDQEAFLRTVYIAQNDCYAGATDSINAKLGNLAESLGDMRDYEKVQQVLRDLRNSLTPGRRTGSLRRQSVEIAQLRDELRRSEAVEQSVSELEKMLQDCLEERRRALAERERVSAQWETANRQRAVEASRLHYESILGKLAEKRGAVDTELAGLGGSAPERELLQRMQGKRRSMVQREADAAANALSPEEETELARLRVRFAAGTPEEAELARCRSLTAQLAELEREAAKKCLSGEERAEYERLRAGFEGRGAVGEARLEEGLRLCGLYLDKKNGIGAKRAALGSMKRLAQSAEAQERQKEQAELARRNRRRILLSALALSALALGGLLLWAGQPSGVLAAGAGQAAMGPLSWGAVFLGAALLCTGVVFGLSAFGGRRPAGPDAAFGEEPDGQDGLLMLEREIGEDEAQMERARAYLAELLQEIGWMDSDFEEDVYRVRDELYGLKSDLRSFGQLQAREMDYREQGYEERERRLREEAEELLRPYCTGGEFAREELQQLCAGLERDAADFSALELRAGKCRRAREEAGELERELKCFLEANGQAGETDLDNGLQNISRSLQAYEKDRQELDILETERQRFEADFDVRSFEESCREDGETADELKRRLDELEERAERLWESAHAYQAQLDERQQELDELQAKRDRLEELEREYDAGFAYYTNLGLVSEYLEKAKESLSARYIGPVLDSFRRNYELLAGEDGEDFRMDANIHVTRRVCGAQRERGAFSLGSQDLVNIVLRVALVEAMYRKEKPFLIMDDSFVNLDETHLGTAGTFLRRIAEEYQVIYFTCHESRAL